MLAAPWPVSVSGGGEICGVDVGPGGGPWASDYTLQKVFKYSASGTATGTIDIGFNSCKVAVDHSNGDVYAAPYSGGEIVKFTAASGYTTQVKFPAPGVGNPGLAVNDAEHKLYVGNGSSSVEVYDTETAGLVETITLPEGGGSGIAVDEATDTLFATVGFGASGYIVEYLGLTTPKATTGEPIGNSEVSGTADPNGVGPITECYFEYGLTTAYGGKQNCAESTPIASEESVHANLPGLTGEETYHYRLVLTNGEPHVVGRGADKTIIPHNVKGLTTEPATEVTQESAVLNAKYEGTGEDTHYYFEWGQTTSYGHKTATPPGDDDGVKTGPATVFTEIAGLEPGITYHYRVVGQNTVGVSKAGDRSFTTYELPSIDSVTSSHLTAKLGRHRHQDQSARIRNDLLRRIRDHHRLRLDRADPERRSGRGQHAAARHRPPDRPAAGPIPLQRRRQKQMGAGPQRRPELQLLPPGMPELDGASAERKPVPARLPCLRARLARRNREHRALQRRSDAEPVRDQSAAVRLHRRGSGG